MDVCSVLLRCAHVNLIKSRSLSSWSVAVTVCRSFKKPPSPFGSPYDIFLAKHLNIQTFTTTTMRIKSYFLKRTKSIYWYQQTSYSPQVGVAPRFHQSLVFLFSLLAASSFNMLLMPGLHTEVQQVKTDNIQIQRTLSEQDTEASSHGVVLRKQ